MPDSRGEGSALGVAAAKGRWSGLSPSAGVLRRLPIVLAVTACWRASRLYTASQFAARTGTITLIVSHRMSTVRAADRIALVEGGQIREFGTHAELIAAAGPYRELCQTQAAAYVR